MFRKILIANRGEIACRVMATAKRFGVATVAVYSDADARARHVELADEAWPLGAAPARESYLSIEKILDAAHRSGAEAVHPGYGFLAENADFAAACSDAGIVFVGPSPQAMRLMGSKTAAKALMEEAGVPVVPGYHGAAQDVATLSDAAGRIGFPLLVKAAAGGGGKGMKLVATPQGLHGAIESAKREALSSFGDDELLLEKRLEQPRHIEVQIFGDSYGDVVAFPERDCSIQRRHQKILEETPAPNLSPRLRAELREAALAAARAVDYVGAGTVEFLVEGDAFYFLEMNTRLQVEHPITEMVVRQDLVEWQLRVAGGERLPLGQEHLAPRGHAIETRLYAEAPARDFLPSTGVIEHLREPCASANVRIETGVREGDEITPYYDPLIAKLVVWDENRDDSLSRLRGALRDYEIVGVETNLHLLSSIATSEDFAAAQIDTEFVPRHFDLMLAAATSLDEKNETTILAAVAAAWLADLRKAARAHPPSPWNALDAWRQSGEGVGTLVLLREGETLTLRVQPSGDAFRLETPTASVMVEATEDTRGMSLCIGGVTRRLSVVRRPGGFVVVLEARNHVIQLVDPLAPPRVASTEDTLLTAPLPARVTGVLAAVGDEVKKGAPLVTLEAMKMEISLAAPRDARIAAIRRRIGDMVQQGEELVSFGEGEAA